MQIKKYLAPTLKEAIAKMKAELGENAIVLSTKIIEADLKAGKEKMFEVTSGAEDDYDAAPQIKKEESAPKKASFETELKKLTEKIYGKEKEIPKKDIQEKPQKTSAALRDDFESVAETLSQRDVSPENIKTIIKQLEKYTAFINPKNIDSYVVSTIGSLIPTSAFQVGKRGEAKIISLVGPTGVGKTTCIAKLAVISKILHKLDIGLISIDTYRLGALDQLKTFSEVSGIDFLVAYEPADLVKAVNKFKKKDLIFIDTVGRSQNNKILLESINQFLQAVKADEIYLVLNTTSTSKNMIDVAEKFNVINYDSFIFTKLDEAVSCGNILNLVAKINKPVKYLTNGQVIPDDILAADAEFIANLIYTGKVII